MQISIANAIGAARRVGGSPTPDVPVHVWLLAGQSNMVGRATFDGGDVYPSGTLQYPQPTGYDSNYTDTSTIPAVPILTHWDSRSGDMGLAIQFAIEYAAANNVNIVFIPAADGGTGFGGGNWKPGDPQYNHAVNATNALMAANPSWLFQGILWHQGESDNNYSLATNLHYMIQRMRNDIDVANSTTPFVLGQLLIQGSQTGVGNFTSLNITPQYVYNAILTSAQGLSLFDGLHFGASSLRTFGERYNANIVNAVNNIGPSSLPDVTGFFLFGTDNMMFEDLSGNSPNLTETISSPVAGLGYLNIPGPNSALLTSINETDNMTMIVVFEEPDVSTQTIMQGTLASAGNPNGVSFYTQAQSLRFNSRGDIGIKTIGTLSSEKKYVYVALKINADAGTWNSYFAGDSLINAFSGTFATRDQAGKPYAIGSYYYNVFDFRHPVNIVCSVFYDKADIDLASVHTSLKPTLRQRGIVLGTSAESFGFTINTTLGDALPQFVMPFENSGTYDCYVYWGDGSNDHITAYNDAALTHSYQQTGYYNIRVFGTFGSFAFNNGGDAEKVIDIDYFGPNFASDGSAFYGATNLQANISATNIPPNNINLTDFFNGTPLTESLQLWDVSQVSSFTRMLKNTPNDNNYDVWSLASATNCDEMFPEAMSNDNLEATLYEWSLNPDTNANVSALLIGGATTRVYAGGTDMQLALYEPSNGLVSTKGWNITGLDVPSGTKLLDFYPDAVSGYSLRQLREDQLVGCRIKRLSDNAEQDIGFDANGALNRQEVIDFCAGSAGLLVKFYDQREGGTNDAVVSSGLALLYGGSSFFELNGNVSVLGSGDVAFTFTPQTIDDNFTVCSVAGWDVGKAVYGEGSTSSNYFRPITSTSIDIVAGGVSQTISVNPQTTNAQYLGVLYKEDGVDSGFFFNGEDRGELNALTSSITVDTLMNATSDTWGMINGAFQEFVAFPSASPAKKRGITREINTFYGAFPFLLLDNYPADGAYSMRRVKTEYTGSLITVSRESDGALQDIGYDLSTNILDVSALTSFATGTRAYVHRWYDQENGNHAVSPNSNARPLIYDDVTGSGIIESNGLPSMLFDGIDDVLIAPSGVITGSSALVTNVVQFVNFIDAGQPWGDQSSLGVRAYISATTYRVQVNSNTGSTQVTNSVMTNPQNQNLVTSRIVSGDTDIYQNNTRIGGMSSTWSSIASNGNVTIGARNGGSQYLNGYQQEVIFWNRKIREEQREAIQAETISFYSIPV